MIARKIATGLLSAFLLGNVFTNVGAVEAATRSNLDRDDVIYNNVEYYQPSTTDNYQAKTVKVGYIITGDDDVLLDDRTMGYIRRILKAKFPGDRFPAKRMSDTEYRYDAGRRNYGDKYILQEATDVLTKEYEKLEDIYQTKTEDMFERGIGLNGSTVTVVGNNAEVAGNNVTVVGNKAKLSGNSGEVDPLGLDNSYNFKKHLFMLPKADYLRFARELQASGGSDYDYLLMFKIQHANTQYKEKFISTVILNDYKIAVKAIDINKGEYIDRGEYMSRGTAGSWRFSDPSKRTSMREAILNGMVESFEHLPIGMYSICDNKYCPRRQQEKNLERLSGKITRHCIKHCNDKTECYTHMVDYEKDADLPWGYLTSGKENID